MIKINKPIANRISQVLLVFQITQHKRDELLMRSFIEYFSCGKVYKHNDAYDFRVTKFSDLITKIVPFKITSFVLNIRITLIDIKQLN